MSEVTVVIPTYNKDFYLGLTLAGFARQTYKDFEVIVVDDGGTADLEPALDPIRDRVDLKLVRQENAGRAAARNAGARAGKGSLLIFCDDDRIPDEDFVEAHVRASAGAQHVRIGQKRQALTRWIPNALPTAASLIASERLRGELSAVEDLVSASDILQRGATQALTPVALLGHRDNFDSVRAIYGDSFAGFRLPWLAVTTANLSLSRAVFESVGGFETAYAGWGAEDTDLGYRLWCNNYEFTYIADAINYHQVHPIGTTGDYELDVILRQKQLQLNATRMARKYETLEVFLFQGMCESRFSPLEASTIAQDLAERNLTDRVMREILALYQKAS
ncbi:Glycosyltransferase, GT2 family [Microbacterium azadirachtae]|uniref:Glycosyltransferase, GT2 family n=1 Tax=Microbacterium azadirachtae TaxID=582680 RepID=A0A1I6G033_9MICO|nr:glycosyltransferase [Microbacterium azadirachtae]SFR35501.1 Glycosyltransferase, GT2 family [Microbacterium azadirachtae]